MKKMTPSGTRTRVTNRPLGRTLLAKTLADRLGQRGDLLQPLGDPLQAGLRQSQAIDQGRTESGSLGGGAVPFIRLEQTRACARRMRAADRVSQSFFCAPVATANCRAAWRARRAVFRA